MKWIGLTGGIATGKSTVARLLTEFGYVVVDADHLARQAVAKNSQGFKDVVALFGQKVLGPEGDLDRQRLGQLVFSSRVLREKLEAIVHPIVRQLAFDEKSRLTSTGLVVAFYDVPLLFEKNLEALFDEVLLVYAPEVLQLERLMQRNGYDEAEARKRLEAQVSIEEKKRRSQFVISNVGSVDFLEAEIKKCLKKMKIELPTPAVPQGQ